MDEFTKRCMSLRGPARSMDVFAVIRHNLKIREQLQILTVSVFVCLPSCKLTNRHGKSPFFLVNTIKMVVFPGRFVSLPECNVWLFGFELEAGIIMVSP